MREVVSGRDHRQAESRGLETQRDDLYEDGVQLHRQGDIPGSHEQGPMGKEMQRQEAGLQENTHGCAEQQEREEHNRTPPRGR